MINITEVKIGDKVHYYPEHYKRDAKSAENGIVKSINKNSIDSVFVVYNCGKDWKNFTDYTGANTNIRDLYLGWKN